MSKGKSSEQSSGLFSNLLGTKQKKGVTKQRGKSKDRYHQDPPEAVAGEYDSEVEIRIGYSHHEAPTEKPSSAKSKFQSLLKSPASDQYSDHQRDSEHQTKTAKSTAKGGGRETPKKSKIQSLFGTTDDSKSPKKKSQDRYHQKNPYEKYEKGESKGGKSGEKSSGGGWFSGGMGGDGGGSSGKTKVGKSKERSTGRQSKGGGSGGFSIPSF